MSLAEKYLKKIPQYTRNKRHFRSLVEHGTPRKWANLVRIELERKAQRLELKGNPYLLIIDTCNYCNLQCPLCPTGLGSLGRPKAMLTFEQFKAYFDPLAPYLFETSLHNWGEALLNKEVYRMIDYAMSRNVGTNLSSNLVRVDSSDIDSILDSGLEYLAVSLDGTSQETYEQYRVLGDYERVIDNLDELIRRRNARGMKTPVVEWQYIMMKHNEHQVSEAEELSKKLGVDLIRFIPVGIPFESSDRKELMDKWFPSARKGGEQQLDSERRRGPCFYLYRSMVINPDGGISPCCIVYRMEYDFGDIKAAKDGVMSIWNNEKYRSARSLFSSETVSDFSATVCDGCKITERHESKKKVRRRTGKM